VALGGVDLEIRAGEILRPARPNGAGKTTLISVVTGLARATSGEARVLGRDVVRDYRFTRRQVGLVPQEINFDPFFTVEEALRFQAGYFDVRLTEARLVELLTALDLTAKRQVSARALSGGMRRRLLIAKALVHEPRCCSSTSRPPGWTWSCAGPVGLRRTLRDRGTTVVLTTHYLEEAEALADRIGVIDRGRLLLVEEKAALLARSGGARWSRSTWSWWGARRRPPRDLARLPHPAGQEIRRFLRVPGQTLATRW